MNIVKGREIQRNPDNKIPRSTMRYNKIAVNNLSYCFILIDYSPKMYVTLTH